MKRPPRRSIKKGVVLHLPSQNSSKRRGDEGSASEKGARLPATFSYEWEPASNGLSRGGGKEKRSAIRGVS